MLESILRRSGWKDAVIVLISAVAIIMIWRGVWNLLDAYLLVENFIASQIASIILGIFILFSMSSYGNTPGKKKK